MRLFEFADKDELLKSVMETTIAGNIASLPMAGSNIIRRIPTEPNLFGYIPAPKPKSKKKRKKSS